MERAPGGLVGKPLPAQTLRQRDRPSREEQKKRCLPGGHQQSQERGGQEGGEEGE